STIVFPLGVLGVQIGMRPTLEMLAENPAESLLVAAVIAPGGPDDAIDPRALEKVGVAARLSDRLNLPGGTVQATIQGLHRIRLVSVEEAHGFVARVEPAVEPPVAEDVAEDLIARILTALEALAAEVDRISPEVPRILRMNVADPGRFADLVATLANFSASSKDRVLQHLDVRERLEYVLEELEGQLRRVRQVEKARDEAAAREEEEEPTTPAERAAALRHRIKMLRAELGEVDPVEREAIELLRRIDAAHMPAQAAAEARAEVERLRSVNPTSSETSDIRSYLDWLLHMPWTQRATTGTDAIDLTAVRKALDEELLGLDDPKDRLLDYLAVAKLRGDLRGPIPCIVGPPDVGKTALVTAFARGLGRPLASLDLGGRGESALIGTRRTRSGAQPGKIAGALRDVGVRDPVFLLEEMDQIGLGKVDGDPIEALEEALNWEGRQQFVDRYLDIPFDLTDTLFIATAQDFYRVPGDLRDLLVEIRIAGYTPEEKVDIALERMLPRLIEEHGLEPGDFATTAGSPPEVGGGTGLAWAAGGG